MSIHEHISKINPYKRAITSNSGVNSSENPDVEIVSYDENGEIINPKIFRKLFLFFLIILVSTLSFGLGRLSNKDTRQGIKIDYDPNISESLENKSVVTSSLKVEKIETQAPSAVSSEVVASAKGTKYHYLHCGGAKQISEANKITFKSSTAAEAAGYTLALNCKPR